MAIAKQLSKLIDFIFEDACRPKPPRHHRLRRLLIEEMEARRVLTTIDLASLASGEGTIIFAAQDGGTTGVSVSSAGDVNGDGFDDVVIGASAANSAGNTRPSAGESYLIFGGPTLPTTIDLANLGSGGITILGANAHDHSGTVSSAGDINGDGFDDLIIGAPVASALGDAKPRAGESYVIFGSASLPATIDLSSLGSLGTIFYGVNSFDTSGTSISGAGDVNGDGFDDLIIGADEADALNNTKSLAGESYVIFGAASLPATIDLVNLGSAGITIFGADTGDKSGASVKKAGDVNGDGFDDLVIGATEADGANNAKSLAGDSYVIFGSASLPATIDLANLGVGGITIHGVDNIDRSGTSVSAAGDINGDGIDDLIVGAAGGASISNARASAGESYVIFGSPSLPTILELANLGSAGITIFGAETFDRSGTSVSSAGDVNGDGFDDILIGASGGDGAANAKTAAGESYIIFGGLSLPPTIDLANLTSGGVIIYGVDSFDQSGGAVNKAGDVNGDGYDDFVIGAIGAQGINNASSRTGEGYIVFGRDFTDTVTHQGTAAPDTIAGTTAADVMIGGRNDDILVGNGGTDVLRGGEGDDILAVSDLAFSRIVGGNGFDTLRLDGSGLTLDLTTIADNRILGIEQIDIKGTGDNTLALVVNEVLGISDKSNTLVVRRNTGDNVNIGAGWTQAANEIINTEIFEVFTQGVAVLKVQWVNQTPIALSLSPSTVVENVPAGTIVGTLNTSDPNSGETFTYTFATGIGDTDNSSFTINGDQITINSSPDFDTKSSYNIRVRTTDQGGLFIEQNFTINVTQVPSVVIAATPSEINENGGVATITATLSHATIFEVLVNLSFSGTATTDVDYSTGGLVIPIPAGSLTGSIDITAINDSDIEGDEMVIVDIDTVANAVELAQQQVIVGIIDYNAPPPSIENISINDGSSTRSHITSLTVKFDSEVDHIELASAFTLNNIDTSEKVEALIVTPTNNGGKTSVLLTFQTGTSVVGRDGSGILGNTLANGNYRLDVLAAKVQGTNGSSAMLADYSFGGQTAGQPDNDDFFRLFGDDSGDGFVDGLDLNAFLSTFANPSDYNSQFDSNGDGFIDGTDLNSFLPNLTASRT